MNDGPGQTLVFVAVMLAGGCVFAMMLHDLLVAFGPTLAGWIA